MKTQLMLEQQISELKKKIEFEINKVRELQNCITQYKSNITNGRNIINEYKRAIKILNRELK